MRGSSAAASAVAGPAVRLLILQVYYYNTVTGDSSWSAPEDLAGGAPAGGGGASVPVSTTAVKGTSWSEILCSDGKTYYHNSATQVTARQIMHLALCMCMLRSTSGRAEHTICPKLLTYKRKRLMLIPSCCRRRRGQCRRL